MSRHRIQYIAQANHRANLRPFGIKRRDRRSHMYVIGKTGTGKSTLLRVMIEQDLRGGEGLALLDPHGDLVEEVRARVPESRLADLIYLDTPAASPSWHFNPFDGFAEKDHALAAAGLVEVFKKLWPKDWGPRLEHLLRNVVFTLLATPGASMGHIPHLLTNRTFRIQCLRHVSDRTVRDFWFNEYDKYSPGFRAVVIAPLQNKVGAMLTDPRLREILTAEESSFDLRQVMDRGQILLVNLSKGQIGEGPAALLGSLLVSHLGLAGLARADTEEDKRRDFFLYLDEFQTFATLSLANMLSELRKYRVNLVLSHQYLSQLEPEIRDAVLGNAGTLMTFRVGATDAGFLARELAPTFEPEDLLRLPNFNINLKLMIDGQPSKPFSATTFASSDFLAS